VRAAGAEHVARVQVGHNPGRGAHVRGRSRRARRHRQSLCVQAVAAHCRQRRVPRWHRRPAWGLRVRRHRHVWARDIGYGGNGAVRRGRRDGKRNRHGQSGQRIHTRRLAAMTDLGWTERPPVGVSPNLGYGQGRAAARSTMDGIPRVANGRYPPGRRHAVGVRPVAAGRWGGSVRRGTARARPRARLQSGVAPSAPPAG
jgi:hypothetical protein